MEIELEVLVIHLCAIGIGVTSATKYATKLIEVRARPVRALPTVPRSAGKL